VETAAGVVLDAAEIARSAAVVAGGNDVDVTAEGAGVGAVGAAGDTTASGPKDRAELVGRTGWNGRDATTGSSTRRRNAERRTARSRPDRLTDLGTGGPRVRSAPAHGHEGTRPHPPLAASLTHIRLVRLVRYLPSAAAEGSRRPAWRARSEVRRGMVAAEGGRRG
jgi:hypothetical protein